MLKYYIRELESITMVFLYNEGISLPSVIQIFYPSAISVLYNKDDYINSSIV